MKSLSLCILLVVAVALGSSGCAQAPAGSSPSGSGATGETFDLVLQAGAPISTPFGEDAIQFAELVREITGGRVNIDVKSENQIVPAFEAAEAVSEGVLDMWQCSPAFDIGMIGPTVYLLGSSGFPGGPTSLEFLAWYYQGGGREVVNDVYQGAGLNSEIVGCISPYPPELFGHYNNPITSVEDFNGISYRTVGPWKEVLESFGAAVVSVPGAEVYEAAQRGVIDAFEYSIPSVNWAAGFHELLPYIGVPGVHSPCMVNLVHMNRDTLAALPEDLQGAIRAATEACSATQYYRATALDAIAMQNYIDYGTKIFEVPQDVQEAIIAKSAELVEKNIAENELYAEVWEQQSAFIKQYRQLVKAQSIPYSLYD